MSQREQELIDQIMSRGLSLWDLTKIDLSGLDLAFSGRNGVTLIRACLLVNDSHNVDAAISFLFDSGAPITDAELQFASNLFPKSLSGRRLLDSLLSRRELMAALKQGVTAVERPRF